MTTTSINAVEQALYNVITAASLGHAVYNESAPPNTSLPYDIIEYVTSTPDDAVNLECDELDYIVKHLGDSQDRVVGSLASASCAGKIRAALTGPDALNVTGSLSGYTCTGLRRGAYVKYMDASGTWHIGWTFRIRVSQ